MRVRSIRALSSNGDCREPSNSVGQEAMYGYAFGPSSRCVFSSVVADWMGYQPSIGYPRSFPACFPHRCITSDASGGIHTAEDVFGADGAFKLEFRVGTTWVNYYG